MSLLSWHGGGSDDEVAAMINDHYAGLIDVAEYWQIGDMRTITLNAIASGTTGESQSSKNVQLVIIGINHDDKADGSGKAIITVQTKSGLSAKGYMNPAYNGPLYALWSASKRREWCNSNFKSALPSYLQNLIKPVTKYSNRYCHSGYSGYSSYRTHEATTDSVFLLGEYEIWGQHHLTSEFGELSADGVQYEYMKTQSNRNPDTSLGSDRWTRLGFVWDTGVASFETIYPGGSVSTNNNATIDRYILPAFCL